MKPKIIRSENLKEEAYGDTKVTTIINSEEWPLSVAKVRKTGDDIKAGHDPSDTVYYVLEGEGVCVINGEEHKIKKGDCVVYPKGTKYKHLKGLVLLAISVPRFSRDKRVYVE